MKTTLLLFLFVTLGHAADAQKAADAWQQSITAESSSDFTTAMQQVINFKNAGGDPYLASVRAGWLSYQAKDHEKAVQFYTAAAKQEPRAITPHLGLTYTFLEMQKPKEALTAARAKEMGA